MAMKFSHAFGAAIAAALSLSAAHASTYKFDFAGHRGTMSKVEVFNDTTTTRTVAATAINTEQDKYSGKARVYQGGLGLGVNRESDCHGWMSPLKCFYSFKEFDDGAYLDSTYADEALIFDLGVEYSLDKIVLRRAKKDNYRIFGTNLDLTGVTTGGLGALTAATVATELAAGVGTTDGAMTVELGGRAFRFLIATAMGGEKWASWNDFTVHQLWVTEMPVPGALPLMATALAGFGAARWRNRRRAV